MGKYEIPAKRERIVDTPLGPLGSPIYYGKAPRTELDNTRTYRALMGEKFEWKEPEIPEDDPIHIWYEELINCDKCDNNSHYEHPSKSKKCKSKLLARS